MFFKCFDNGRGIYYWLWQQKMIASLREEGEIVTCLILIREWSFQKASVGEDWLGKSVKASLQFVKCHDPVPHSHSHQYSCSMTNPARFQNANKAIIAVLGLFLFSFFAWKTQMQIRCHSFYYLCLLTVMFCLFTLSLLLARWKKLCILRLSADLWDLKVSPQGRKVSLK